MFKSRRGSVSELCTNPIIFWRSPRFVSQKSDLDTIPVNRVFLISTRPSPPEKSLYFVFQRGSGFRWQTDGSGDGQQHCHAVRHGFAKGGLQTFNEPGRNLIEPQTRLGGVTLASVAPFEGCDVNSNPFSSDHDIGVGGITTLFPRCREPSGDGFDGGSLLLLQIPHASLPPPLAPSVAPDHGNRHGSLPCVVSGI